MTTTNLFNLAAMSIIQQQVSANLFKLIKFDGTGATDAVFPQTLDLSYQGFTDADFLGFNLFSGQLQNLTLPISSSNIQGQDVFNIGNFTSLKKLISNDTSKCIFSGSMVGLTSLTDIKMNVSSARAPYILVQLSAYPNLVNVTITGSAVYGISDVGTLGALTHLATYKLTCPVAQATTNNILSTLHTAKAAGAPLTTVFLTGTAAPTGGTSNADYLYLTGAGVSVTL